MGRPPRRSAVSADRNGRSDAPGETFSQVTGQNRHGTANTAHGPAGRDGRWCRWRSCEGSIMTDHYDVIVIGSGAGGGTLTYALAPTGMRPGLW